MDMETKRQRDKETWRHGDMDMETSNGKKNPRPICGISVANAANGTIISDGITTILCAT
jgi:hypothetical protein